MRMAFWIFHDHAGKLTAANIGLVVLTGLPALAGFMALGRPDGGVGLIAGALLLIAAFCVIMPVCAAAIAHLVKILIDRRDAEWRELFRGARMHWKSATALGLLYAGAAVTLGISVWFYTAQFGAALPWFGLILGGVSVWALIGLGLTFLYAVPALVQKGEGALPAMKLAALLVLDRPLLAGGLALQCAAFGLIAAVFVPVLLFFYAAWCVTLSCAAYELLARYYASVAPVTAPDPQQAPAAPGQRAVLSDGDDDYLNRGFRDFVFPWRH